jgi:nucleoside-diphosphate-sugar epimerase
MKTQAIVFGGSGFIGSHLVEHLVGDPEVERVVVVDVREPVARRPKVVYHRHDVRKAVPPDLAATAATAARTVIYNLAAVHRNPGHPLHEYYETNVLGALNVCDFARAIDCEEIVFTSSIAVYGSDEIRKSETTPPAPESAYGWSKLLAERVHQSWRRERAGRRLTISRPAVIFGAGENGNFTRLARTLKRGTFFFPGRRDTVKACGYVGELVRALEFIRSRKEPETLFNFCYGRHYTIKEICDAFHEIGGLARPRGTVPLPLMNLAALGFEALNTLGLPNSINRDRVAKLVRSTNIEPAVLIALGYEYRTDLVSALETWAASPPQDEFV